MTYDQMAPALVAAKVPRSVIREWMFDSGCGNDLVSIESVAALRDNLRQLSEPKWFATANGANQANTVIDFDVPELGEVVTPYVMDGCPDVLSMGYRCVVKGCGFYWPPYAHQPTLQLPKEGGALRIKLPVEGYIPYMYATEAVADDHAAPIKVLPHGGAGLGA